MSTALLGLALALAAPAPKEEKKDPPTLVGEWALESVTFAGRPLPDRRPRDAPPDRNRAQPWGSGPAGQAGRPRPVRGVGVRERRRRWEAGPGRVAPVPVPVQPGRDLAGVPGGRGDGRPAGVQVRPG